MLLSFPSLPSVGGAPTGFPRIPVLIPAPLRDSKPGARMNFLSPSGAADKGGRSNVPVPLLAGLQAARHVCREQLKLIKSQQ